MVKRFAFRTASRLFMQPWYRQVRGMTLGTRSVVLDGTSRVLLIRHTYAPGWFLPGGGVERGETIYAAACRELREETSVIAEEAPALLGLFLNDRVFPGDHVACFILRRFRRDAWSPSREIAAAEFFDPAALPAETTGGSRRRIAQALGAPVESWIW
ncbi:MAG: NUDIX domain-containing protein [Hyphomicrobiales bacterium]|jgi:8-oxo-dGTP pyrophosphatase MutT (NUDIX family)